jgi:lipopolysaccharide transport system ATP-binding protein
MVVRLAFAIAISVDAGILVIDEALAVGDELFQRKCYSKLETLKSQGVTILFVSHSASAILDLSDKALLLDRGEMLALGEPKYVVGQYQKLLYAPEELRESLRSELKETLVGSEGSDAVLAEDSGIDGNILFCCRWHPTLGN